MIVASCLDAVLPFLFRASFLCAIIIEAGCLMVWTQDCQCEVEPARVRLVQYDSP
jgi:hypothetical protein